MTAGIGINGDQATLVAPIAEAAIRQLIAARPARLELVGDWSDLAPLTVIAADVKQLYIAGDFERGRIKGISGLGQFKSLTRLRLASVVKGGYDLGLLPTLEELEVAWQAETAEAFKHPKLRSLTLKSFSGSDFTAIDVPRHSHLARLWFATPKLEHLDGIERFANLQELRITDAKKMASLSGMALPQLLSLDIENASSLSDVSAIALSPALQTLRLNSIGAEADLSVLSRLLALRNLQVGGRSAPNVDWLSLMRMPSLQKIFAWWDPDRVNDESLRESAEEAGRKFLRFEPVAGRGRRPLLVELA